MLYELLFGYEDGGDEWTKAEGYAIRDIVIKFFRFIERTNIEKHRAEIRRGLGGELLCCTGRDGLCYVVPSDSKKKERA